MTTARATHQATEALAGPDGDLDHIARAYHQATEALTGPDGDLDHIAYAYHVAVEIMTADYTPLPTPAGRTHGPALMVG